MSMSNLDIVQGLRGLADELKPFTQEVTTGSRVWNGSAYVEAEPRKLNPYALAWWSALTSIADLIELQNAPLTPQQFDYLKKRLFGGMGSLSDFALDTKQFGDAAAAANEKLDTKRSEFYRLFQSR
jgi:hypothetical protein